MENLTMDGVERLQNAVLKLTIEDYLELAPKYIGHQPKNVRERNELKSLNEIREFLKSDYFLLFSKLSGTGLLKQLDQEVSERRRMNG